MHVDYKHDESVRHHHLLMNFSSRALLISLGHSWNEARRAMSHASKSAFSWLDFRIFQQPICWAALGAPTRSGFSHDKFPPGAPYDSVWWDGSGQTIFDHLRNGQQREFVEFVGTSNERDPCFRDVICGGYCISFVSGRCPGVVLHVCRFERLRYYLNFFRSWFGFSDLSCSGKYLRWQSCPRLSVVLRANSSFGQLGKIGNSGFLGEIGIS